MDVIKLKQDYDHFGYVKIENFFSADEVEEIITEYSVFLKIEAPFLKGKDINYADKNSSLINSIHKLNIREDSYFSNLLNSQKTKSIANIFLSGNSVGRKVEMFAKPAEKGLKSPPHQDNFYWCLKPFLPGTALTIWTALDYCDKNNGGITYLKGSHKYGIINHINSYAPGSSQTIEDSDVMNKFEIVTPDLKPGDILIHDSLTIHYSEDNLSGRSRRGMTLQYQSDKATLDDIMFKHYEAELDKQVFLRNVKS